MILSSFYLSKSLSDDGIFPFFDTRGGVLALLFFTVCSANPYPDLSLRYFWCNFCKLKSFSYLLVYRSSNTLFLDLSPRFFLQISIDFLLLILKWFSSAIDNFPFKALPIKFVSLVFSSCLCFKASCLWPSVLYFWSLFVLVFLSSRFVDTIFFGHSLSPKLPSYTLPVPLSIFSDFLLMRDAFFGECALVSGRLD